MLVFVTAVVVGVVAPFVCVVEFKPVWGYAQIDDNLFSELFGVALVMI